MNGKVLVHTAQAGDEVILERADGAFGSIATMDVGWSKLEVNIFLNKEVLEGVGAFIVKTMETRAQSGSTQLSMNLLEGGNNRMTFAIFDWFCQNGVAVIII